ncbi:hypothetical protein ACJX0J_037246, partial [Zea mays]
EQKNKDIYFCELGIIVIMEELGDDDAYQQEQLAICLRINCHYLRYVSPSAYYWFFGQLAYLLNISMLRVAQAEYMIEALKLGEIETGQGLNQEMGLARPGDT